MKQNENLKVQVKNLKFDLECIRVQNGGVDGPFFFPNNSYHTFIKKNSCPLDQSVHQNLCLGLDFSYSAFYMPLQHITFPHYYEVLSVNIGNKREEF